ncbi:MAG: hypothetical protein IKQ17_00380 [Kiritimatiellae bacterium]|nr:hypothetical protein [Kiritimatiellia bacterium]
MNKKLLILSLLAAAVLAGITKNGNLGVGIGVLAVVVLFIVSQLPRGDAAQVGIMLYYPQ